MNLEAQLAAINGGCGSFPLPDGDVLRLTGKDVLVALDRVISQEVKSIHEGEARLALLLAAKGQFRALMAVCRAAGEILVVAASGHGNELARMLEGYLKFSRIAVEPLAWGGGSLALLGPDACAVAGALAGGGDPGAMGRCRFAGEAGDRLLWIGQTFVGAAGGIVLAESESARERLAAALRAAGAVALDEAAVELARIGAGFPAWGRELTETVLPPEVGLDATAISYTKGCYVGQETMARLQTYGRPNRTLVGVHEPSGPDQPPALPLPLTAGGENKPRGSLTSWGRHPLHGGVGLALVRREIAAPGTILTAADRTFLTGPFPIW